MTENGAMTPFPVKMSVKGGEGGGTLSTVALLTPENPDRTAAGV